MLKEASPHMYWNLLLIEGGERKEGLLNTFRSLLANKVPHPGSSPKEEGKEWNMTMAKHGKVTDIVPVADSAIKWPPLHSSVPTSTLSKIKKSLRILMALRVRFTLFQEKQLPQTELVNCRSLFPIHTGAYQTEVLKVFSQNYPSRDREKPVKPSFS